MVAVVFPSINLRSNRQLMKQKKRKDKPRRLVKNSKQIIRRDKFMFLKKELLSYRLLVKRTRQTVLPLKKKGKLAKFSCRNKRLYYRKDSKM